MKNKSYFRKSSITFDFYSLVRYDKERQKKAESRKDKGNIYPVGMTDATFRNYIIEIFLGYDWRVTDPISQTQVNEEAMEEILYKLTKRLPSERLDYYKKM